MGLQKLVQNKIKRKRFFKSIGTAAAGYLVMKALPFGYLLVGKNTAIDENSPEQIVKINPLAVSRKKIGEEYVGR